MVNHQVMIRDLDWSTKASNLVERVSNLNADAADLIQEIRVTRQGRYFPGKMCTAFMHLRDGAPEEVAQQIAVILGGRSSLTELLLLLLLLHPMKGTPPHQRIGLCGSTPHLLLRLPVLSSPHEVSLHQPFVASFLNSHLHSRAQA